MSQVFYSELPMPAHVGRCHRSMLHVAMRCGALGFTFIDSEHASTDTARNLITRCFLVNSSDPDDVLVMLDADHLHPIDCVERLVAHNVGVVGALAFQRGETPVPCFFDRQDENGVYLAKDFDLDGGLTPCLIVGTGAIAIRRWVFDKLEETNHPYPYFRMIYPEQRQGKADWANAAPWPGEDMYFGGSCMDAGIQHYVDLSLCTPHYRDNVVADLESWKRSKSA